MAPKRDWVSLLLSIVIVAAPIGLFWNMFAATNRNMEKFRTGIRPGMSTDELMGMIGKPTRVINRGERLNSGRRSYEPPTLDEHTAIYFYGREGFPYYNVYVLVDKRRNTVLRSDIENLWWSAALICLPCDPNSYLSLFSQRW